MIVALGGSPRRSSAGTAARPIERASERAISNLVCDVQHEWIDKTRKRLSALQVLQVRHVSSLSTSLYTPRTDGRRGEDDSHRSARVKKRRRAVHCRHHQASKKCPRLCGSVRNLARCQPHGDFQKVRPTSQHGHLACSSLKCNEASLCVSDLLEPRKNGVCPPPSLPASSSADLSSLVPSTLSAAAPPN